MHLVTGPVLIIGGTGYIDSHACKALADGATDLHRHGHAWAVRWGSLERGDIGDGRFVEEVFLPHRPQAASRGPSCALHRGR